MKGKRQIKTGGFRATLARCMRTQAGSELRRLVQAARSVIVQVLLRSLAASHPDESFEDPGETGRGPIVVTLQRPVVTMAWFFFGHWYRLVVATKDTDQPGIITINEASIHTTNATITAYWHDIELGCLDATTLSFADASVGPQMSAALATMAPAVADKIWAAVRTAIKDYPWGKELLDAIDETPALANTEVDDNNTAAAASTGAPATVRASPVPLVFLAAPLVDDPPGNPGTFNGSPLVCHVDTVDFRAVVVNGTRESANAALFREHTVGADEGEVFEFAMRAVLRD